MNSTAPRKSTASIVDFSQKIRINVILRKTYGSTDEYKKMMLVIQSDKTIYELKRTIEQEFLDLFPNEPPYIVAKIEDNFGFSISNSSDTGYFIHNR